jgi:hypothetical protein
MKVLPAFSFCLAWTALAQSISLPPSETTKMYSNPIHQGYCQSHCDAVARMSPDDGADRTGRSWEHLLPITAWSGKDSVLIILHHGGRERMKHHNSFFT